MSLNLIDDKSTLVQVMAWCCRATSHYLNQCWPISMSPYGITRPQRVNVVRKERLRQRKRDKKAVARYCSMSSMDSVSMFPDSAEEEGLDSSECESSSSTHKSVVKVTRPSPAPWDTDVDSPPRKRFKKDSTRGERGRSWEMDRLGRYSKDHSDSGLRDEPSRSRATTEQKHSAGATCCEDWSATNAGSAGASSSGLPQTRLTVLMVLPPHRRKLLRAWCPVLLGLFLAGFRLPWTRFWVLGPLRTKLKMMWLSAQMGPLPCGWGLPRATSPPVLLGHLFGRAGYYGETAEWRVVWELDFHSCTFRPAGGDGSASWPSWLSPGFAGFRHGECCLIWYPDRRLLGYGWQH